MGAGTRPAPTPMPWQLATVEHVVVETHRARTFSLRLTQPCPFIAGQHYDVRLTAPDGYQAQRSYSIASPPSGRTGTIDLTVELIADGEVSPYFHWVVQPGDELEVRGPIGGPFTWTPDMGGPLLLVAGGSGIVPLRSMLAHRGDVARALPSLLLYSTRTLDDIIYRAWLDALPQGDPAVQVSYTLTRRQPSGWSGYARRVDPPMLCDSIARLSQIAERSGAADAEPLCYVCGSTGFVETVADGLLEVGIPDSVIRTERFGPTS